MSKVLAVIPLYLAQGGDVEVALAAIRTLHQTADVDLLVVDDCSPQQELVDVLHQTCASDGLQMELHRKPENTGFSKTVNVGLQRALDEGRDAVLVNADIEFSHEGWLDKMLAARTQKGDRLASVVGGRLLYPNGLIQHAGVYYSLLTHTWGHIYQYGPHDLPEALRSRRCPVTGALQLIRHECLAAIGIYDERFFMGWEDVDYCLRVFKTGRECIYEPAAVAFHHESLFRGRPSPKLKDWQERSFLLLRRKWAGMNFAPFVPRIG